MRVSHEAIYQSLYVQGRGALKRELTTCLRTGRALRLPRSRLRGRGKSFVTPEVMISERPAEAADHQARAQSQSPPSATGSDWGSSGAPSSPEGNAAAGGGGLAGALGGVVKSVTDAFSGPQGTVTETPTPDTRTDAAAPPGRDFTTAVERAAASFNETTALLLVRAMVTAASADSSISAEERTRIMEQAVKGGADPGDQRTLERELANPRPLDELLREVRDQETAEEFYLASGMAVDNTTEVHRVYLGRLRERLGLDEQDAAEIDNLTT